MARPCTICTHPERAAIDQALVQRQVFRAIARQFGVSKDALLRHHDDHIPDLLRQAQAAAETARADELLDQLLDLKSRAEDLLEEARQAQQFGAAVGALREARACVETLAKLAGRLQQETAVRIVLSPEWHGLRAALIASLEPYPEARQAVAEALARLEIST